MSAIRRNILVSTVAASVVATVAVFPTSVSLAAERAPAPIPALPYELDTIAPPSAVEAPKPQVAAIDVEAQRCMAKIVHHEARNQPRAGMIAVAQTLINRVKLGGRFGDSVCDVARKPGQYFNLHTYNPREDSADWHTAMNVAEAALNGSDEPAPGALYFRAAYRPATAFFRSRQRVAAVGDQVFYR